jgi:hypothetical protein
MINLRQATPRVAETGRPLGESGRELISVRGILEWAFGVEHARLDRDELTGGHMVRGFSSRSSTANICEMLEVGRVDASPGQSWPHDDADLVASVLRHQVEWSLALRVAELARAGRVPDWGQGARPRVEPHEWRRTKHGEFAKTEPAGAIVYVERGRVRRMESRVCPVVFRDTARELAARRRAYLDWWGALLSVFCGLQAVELKRFEVTKAMPPMEPWKKGA